MKVEADSESRQEKEDVSLPELSAGQRLTVEGAALQSAGAGSWFPHLRAWS